VVLLALLFLMPLFVYMPYCALASIIEVAVINIIDIDAFKLAWKVSKPEFCVSLLTFMAVIATGIELGLVVGVAISMGAVIYRASAPHMAVLGKVPIAGALDPTNALKAPPQPTEPVGASTQQFEHGTWRNVARVANAVRPERVFVLRIDAALIFSSCAAVKARVAELLAEEEELLREGKIHRVDPKFTS
jgi:SulP family sulfate permease